MTPVCLEALEERILFSIWTGDGVNNHFDNPENWKGEVVPSATEAAEFEKSADVAVTSNASIPSLRITQLPGAAAPTVTLSSSSGKSLTVADVVRVGTANNDASTFIVKGDANGRVACF